MRIRRRWRSASSSRTPKAFGRKPHPGSSAIALHSSADIAERKGPEVALVHFGAHVDVMGLRLEKITPQLVDDTLSLCPRHGFKKVFTEALAEIARQKPHTVIGTGLADVSHRLIPDLAIPNACDLLLGAPFES